MEANLNKKYNTNYKIIKGLSVDVKEGDFAYALRKFKKKVQEDGKLQTLRKKEYYEKPSEKRKREKAAGRARHLKKLQKQKLQENKFNNAP